MNASVDLRNSPDAGPKRSQFSVATILLTMGVVAGYLAGLSQWSPGILLGTSLAVLVWTIARLVRRQNATYLVACLLLLGFPACLVSLAPYAREGDRILVSRNHLKQIALAIQAYEAHHRCLPPPYLADSQGRPMHSWRVLILPFLEQQALYSQYRFDEPWDGPHNRTLHDTMLWVYRGPTHPDDKSPAPETSYLAIVGPGTVWDPERQVAQSRDITDGPGQTLLVVESFRSGIHWMEPRDLHVLQMKPAVNPPYGQGIQGLYASRAQVVAADGSVHVLTPDATTAEQLRALWTIAGGERVKWPTEP